MDTHAQARVFGLLAIMAFVLLVGLPPVISLLRPDPHVQPTDTTGPPPAQPGAEGTSAAPPAQRPLTQAQALETIKSHGYLSVSNPRQDGSGGWTAEASKAPDGRKVTVTVDVRGEVAEK